MHILKRNNQQDETKILQKNQRRRSRGSNNKLFKTKEAACISFLLQREAYATAIYIRINSKGGGKHPCLTHMAMSKGPVSFLSCIHMQLCILVKVFLIMLINEPEHHSASIDAIVFPFSACQTLLFLKINSLDCYWIICSVATRSAHDLFCLNPAWLSRIYCCFESVKYDSVKFSFLGRFTRSSSSQSDGTSSFCQILLRGRIEFWLPNLCLLLGLYRDAVWSWGPAVFNNITAFLIFLTERRSQSTSNRSPVHRQYLCFFF